jgi:putative endopeptidase
VSLPIATASAALPRQIADMYGSLMDQARAEELGLQPIAGVLARIESIETPRELATEAGYLSAVALGGPFLGAVEKDVARPGTPIATIAQGGTLLPDRDYYLQDDARLVQIRAQYVDCLTSILTLAGRGRAAAEARAVLAFETAIARLQWTQEEIRDPAACGGEVRARRARA